MWRRIALLMAVMLATAAQAQSFDPTDYPVPKPNPSFLVLEQDRVFKNSAFGKEVIALNEAEDSELRTEGQRLDRQFEQEEQALTEQRVQLTPEEFRVLADAFDEKVVATRRAQEERGTALVQRAERRQREFLRRIGPILLEILEETGASAVIEQRGLLISKQDLNITDEVIKRLDAAHAAQTRGGDPAQSNNEPAVDQE